MDKPFFSVIVPEHNSAEYMRKGLNSIKAQTFTDYELIVVCDACDDGTEAVARAYADKVIVTNYGRDGLARQAGMDAAEGEFVLFMDDDDWWLHEYVLEELDRMVTERSGSMDVLFFSFIWKGVGYTRQTPERNYAAVWSKCWRRAFVGKTRFKDTPYWSDLEFNRTLLQKRPRAVFWDFPIVYYNYLREGSISWQKKQGEIE